MESDKSMFSRLLAPLAELIRCGMIISTRAAVVFAFACGGQTESPSDAHSHHGAADDGLIGKVFAGDYPIQIVATTGMVADLARNIGGAHVNVEALMGEGVDPHLYKTSSRDVQKMQSADMVLYSGLHLEGKMSDVLVKFARRTPTFAVTEQLDTSLLREPPEFEGQYDPHLWFDVSLWRKTGEFVRDLLMAFDPTHSADYQAAADAYLARLDALHEEVKSRITAIPEAGRVLVTAHDAFGYFGDAYDIEVLAIQGISTESEAGVHKINELVQLLVDRKIKAVFVESSVSDRNIQALIEGANAQGHPIVIGGELYSDAMGQEGTPGGTYIGMVEHNVSVIENALK